MSKEPPSRSLEQPPCPHQDTIEDVRNDLRDVLKLLRGEGPNDPGVIGRIIKLESQSTELTETWRLIRNTAIGALVVGFLSVIGSFVLPHLGGPKP